jgi:hypothetical protein
MLTYRFGEAEVARRRALIEQLNFEVQREYLMRPGSRLGWSEEQVLQVEIWYRRFLTLLLMFPEQHIVPHPAVDQMWHAHIAVDTQQYADDCDTVFGEYIHHDSWDHEMPKETMDLWWERTQQHLRNVFGEDYSQLSWADKTL